MRFGITLISAQLVATVATAQTPSEKAVSILKEVCVAPTTSEGRIAAGKTTALKENWKLMRSEAAPAPMLHNEHGVKNSFISAWEFNLPGASRARLYVSILRPEPSASNILFALSNRTSTSIAKTSLDLLTTNLDQP